MSQQTFDFAAIPAYISGIPAAPRNPVPARATDPQSSKDAAEHAIASGLQAKQRMACLEALRRLKVPSTYREIAAAANIERHAVGRRMVELMRLRLVVRGDIRPCTAGGRPSCEWRLA